MRDEPGGGQTRPQAVGNVRALDPDDRDLCHSCPTKPLIPGPPGGERPCGTPVAVTVRRGGARGHQAPTQERLLGEQPRVAEAGRRRRSLQYTWVSRDCE